MTNYAGDYYMSETLILLIPFIGTALGAAMSLFFRRGLSLRAEKVFLGFAAGVMTAAAIWSLLIPALDAAESWLPVVSGFLVGVGFLLLLDMIIPHLHLESESPEGLPVKLPKRTMLLLAVTLHNIPEGMAVGVALAGSLSESAISTSSALVLSMGIALQNFPEGAVVSMPLLGEGMSRKKAFFCGVLSGAVEPVAALATLFFTRELSSVLPFLLSFAAGAMLYVVAEELIPESQAGKHSNTGTVSAAFGFAVMMVLDVVFG